MAHENSITIQGNDGKWVNIPTVYKGKLVSEAKAKALYEQGYIKPLGGKKFPNEPVASNRAMKRSTQHSHRKGVRPPGAIR
jgi:hypothetical protein